MRDSELRGNALDGVDFRSAAAESAIADCTIAGHANGAGVRCSGPGALTITASAISDCEAGLLLSDGFTARMSGCEISDAVSALVSATSRAVLEMSDCVLRGACVFGIMADSGAAVRGEGVELREIEGTGLSVTGGASVDLKQTTFSDVERSAIEAYKNADIRLTGCSLRRILAAGLTLRDGVTGFLDAVEVAECTAACGFFVNLSRTFRVSNSQFRESNGNGLNLRNVQIEFENCEFVENVKNGVEMRGADTAPVFQNCRFTGNAVGELTVADAAPAFFNCSFTTNFGVGAAIVRGCPTFGSCLFEGNGDGGLKAESASCVTLLTSRFIGNQRFGAHIRGEAVTAAFAECEFSQQQLGSAVVVECAAAANFDSCTFSGNAGLHLEVRESGTAMVDGCFFTQSGVGVGVIVAAGGIAEVKRSEFDCEFRSGIIAGTDGRLVCSECSFARCGMEAVIFQKQSQGRVSGNRISGFGIEIATDEVEVADNVFDGKGVRYSESEKA
jgi:hypothetical protein